MLNAAASVPLRVYVKVSLSASTAAMALPMFWAAAVFSTTVRVVLVPSVKTGALFVVVASAVKVTDAEIPWTLARTVFVPALLPSVSVLCALPLAPVVVLVTLSVPPPAVTANVTGTPANATLLSSRTSTINGCASVVPVFPDCVSPNIFTGTVATRLSKSIYTSLACSAGMCV